MSQEFEKDVKAVWHRMNWNLCEKWGGDDKNCQYNSSKNWVLPNNPFPSFESAVSVFMAMKKYSEEDGGKFPPYDPNKKAEATHISKWIAQQTNVQEWIVTQCLTEAYYSAVDGSTKSDYLVNPRGENSLLIPILIGTGIVAILGGIYYFTH